MKSPETEQNPAIVTRRPFIEEAFTHPQIPKNEFLDQQSRERAATLPAIRYVTDGLMRRQDRSLEGAILGGDISSTAVSELYRGLTTILSDPDYSRLALYLPFDFLTCPDDSVAADFEPFKEKYTEAWWKLLSYPDNRADFVDGNLPDDRNATIEKVVKAAHLIPELLERNILTSEDVEWLREQSQSDDILQRSIDDAFAQEQDPGSYVNVEYLQRIETGLAAKIYKRELQRILALEGDIVDARVQWLERIVREQVIAEIVRQTADNAAAAGTASGLYDGDSFDRQIALGTFEKLLQDHSVIPDDNVYELIFKAALHDSDPHVREQSAISLARLCRTGIFAPDTAISQGIPLNRLSGALSENLPETITNEITRHVAEMMREPSLANSVYPVALIGGSSLKGYGTLASDVDVAVMVRPEVSRDDRHAMRENLTRIYGDQVIEFWLDEDSDGTLSVHDFEEFDFHEADSEWTHTLFQDVWVGEEKTIEELHEHLLPTYFHDSGDLKRYLWLRRIEQDILQYRLLQKGYARCYPTVTDSEKPDGLSAFWDPGYRLLATRLYAEKVFLPKI